MKRYAVDIGKLLSPKATVLHTTRRLFFEKRIVQLEEAYYVLYRFPRKRHLDTLEDMLRRLKAAGAGVQGVAGRTTRGLERLRLGHWIALDYVHGQSLPATPGRDSIASLAENLAKLHAIPGESCRFLLRRGRPRLPHADFLAGCGDLPDRERRWIEESFARLRSVESFRLTHGDLFAKNVITTPDGTIALIDYEFLAFEPAGMELAWALLATFCRKDGNRRLFLERYLRCCTPEATALWEAHGRDFVFAAAARRTITRQRRMRMLRLKNRLMPWRRLMPAGLLDIRSPLSTREKNLAMLDAAEKQEADFRALALHFASLCLDQPQRDLLDLIEEVSARHLAGRKKQPKLPAPSA